MRQFFRICVFVCAVICCTAVPITDELLNGDHEFEFVNIDAKLAPQPYSSEPAYNVKTKAFGKEFDLHLKRLPSIFSKNFQYLSLELDANKNPSYRTPKNQKRDEPVYRDVDTNSVLHIDVKDGEVHLEGSLTPELSIVHSSQVKTKTPTGNHVVVKTNYKKKFLDKMLTFKTHPSIAKGYAKADPVVIPDPVIPELLVVIDYKSVQRLDFDDGRIQKYLSIFWHAVNTRYEALTNPKYQLMVVGIVATKTKDLQPYIELSREAGDATIDLGKTLPYLNIFLYHNLDNVPNFDIAMLMTGEDMAGQDETGGLNPNVAGVAYVAGACGWDPDQKTMMNAGMAEDTAPFYDGVLNHAHEVAHLLGAAHDGDPPVDFLPGHPGAADCPWSDGYLMSYLFGTKNHVRFSDCTVEQLRWLLKEPNGVCLRTLSNNKQLPLDSTLPGQIVDLDDQCRSYMGFNGKYFRGQDMDKICGILYCYRTGETSASSRGPALEGSPCGDVTGKWCKNGECVRKSA